MSQLPMALFHVIRAKMLLRSEHWFIGTKLIPFTLLSVRYARVRYCSHQKVIFVVGHDRCQLATPSSALVLCDVPRPRYAAVATSRYNQVINSIVNLCCITEIKVVHALHNSTSLFQMFMPCDLFLQSFSCLCNGDSSFIGQNRDIYSVWHELSICIMLTYRGTVALRIKSIQDSQCRQ